MFFIMYSLNSFATPKRMKNINMSKSLYPSDPTHPPRV